MAAETDLAALKQALEDLVSGRISYSRAPERDSLWDGPQNGPRSGAIRSLHDYDQALRRSARAGERYHDGVKAILIILLLIVAIGAFLAWALFYDTLQKSKNANASPKANDGNTESNTFSTTNLPESALPNIANIRNVDASHASHSSAAKLPLHSNREDLVRYAKEQAAFYAAQGVPEQEAMAYITRQLNDAVEAQKARNSRGSSEILHQVHQPKSALQPTTTAMTDQQHEMPLILPIVGDIPLSSGNLRTSKPAPIHQHDDEDLPINGRKDANHKKRISAESAEVQDYMTRRREALGLPEEEPPIQPVEKAKVTFQTPNDLRETFL
jgi:hypothetical protein